jgi:PKD repeat protein
MNSAHSPLHGRSERGRLSRTFAAILASTIIPAHAAHQALIWEPSTTATVTGYFVHVGAASGSYGIRFDVRDQTAYTVGNLLEGQTYYFAVQAYDGTGATSGYSNEFSATASGASAPAANFSAAPTRGPAPLAVVFSSVSGGSRSTYLWDFGDGSTSTEPNPIHTYSTVGTFTFRLTVTGPGGSSTSSGSVSTTGCLWRGRRTCEDEPVTQRRP